MATKIAIYAFSLPMRIIYCALAILMLPMIALAANSFAPAKEMFREIWITPLSDWDCGLD